MSVSDLSEILIEQGQALVDYAALTDSGDQQHFTPADSILSGKAGFVPIVRANGIVTGTKLVTIATSGTNDLIDVAAFTAYAIGVLKTVSAAADETIVRGATSDIAKISSVTMDEDGAIAILAGTDSGDNTVNEIRGTAGGPPYIPVDSVELAQVRFVGDGSGDAAAVTADQIFQVAGQHAEYAAYPSMDMMNVGEGLTAETAATTYAHLKTSSVLPLSHTAGVPKRIYVRYYTPIFATESKTLDYVPAGNSHSVSSTQIYGGVVGSSSSSLGQASFTALLTNGITDSLNRNKDQVLTVKYLQDRNQSPYEITQGKIGIGRTFPVADQVNASVTISSENATASFAG